LVFGLIVFLRNQLQAMVGARRRIATPAPFPGRGNVCRCKNCVPMLAAAEAALLVAAVAVPEAPDL
jgi:hypothetical protein